MGGGGFNLMDRGDRQPFIRNKIIFRIALSSYHLVAVWCEQGAVPNWILFDPGEQSGFYSSTNSVAWIWFRKGKKLIVQDPDMIAP